MKNLRLKSARAGKDLSQQELADLVGVSRQTINAIEKGDYNPTIRLCLAICHVLGKTLDELFWEEEEDTPEISSSNSLSESPPSSYSCRSKLSENSCS